MAVSLNSVIIRSFNPSASFEHTGNRVQLRKAPSVESVWKRPRFRPLSSNGDNNDTKTIESSYSNAPDGAANSPPTDEKVQPNPASEASNGAANAMDANIDGSGSTGKPNSTLKRSPLTARERLRAARVLSRYTDSPKPSKPELSSRLLDALQESDKGKRRPGLPEAPTNMFDDSKRGMPKPGWTFNFPGGMDVFFVVLSFVLISTLMFATTYIVWKVGAIHFNEY